MSDTLDTKLPENCSELLSECMQKIENMTGEKYNLYIQQYGKNMTHIYSHVDKIQGRFIVSNIIGEFQDLNGTYNTKKELEDKISGFIELEESVVKYKTVAGFKMLVLPHSKWRNIVVSYENGKIGVCPNDVITYIGDIRY